MVIDSWRLQQASFCQERHSWNCSSSGEGTSLWNGPSRQKSGGPGCTNSCPCTNTAAASKLREMTSLVSMFSTSVADYACAYKTGLSYKERVSRVAVRGLVLGFYISVLYRISKNRKTTPVCTGNHCIVIFTCSVP